MTGGPISESGKRHAEDLARVQAEAPARFVVGAYTDGKKVVASASVDRRWSNGFGLTAYARAWWHDASVTPQSALGAEAGVQARYDFKP